jgi:hypothetical protein
VAVGLGVLVIVGGGVSVAVHTGGSSTPELSDLVTSGANVFDGLGPGSFVPRDAHETARRLKIHSLHVFNAIPMISLYNLGAV